MIKCKRCGNKCECEDNPPLLLCGRCYLEGHDSWMHEDLTKENES